MLRPGLSYRPDPGTRFKPDQSVVGAKASNDQRQIL